MCEGSGTTTVTCTSSAIADSQAVLGAFDDRLAAVGPLPTLVFGDSGNDTLTTTAATVTTPGARAIMIGGTGDDIITGGNGQDGGAGGPGTDLITLGGGDDEGEGNEGPGDVIDLGAGNDYAYLTGADENGDSYRGGAGLDIVEHNVGTTPPVALTLNLAAGMLSGTNSPSGTVTGFEDVFLASQASSTVTGTADANKIVASTGADTVNPGAGPDFLDLLSGNDRALVRDGFPDYVACGEGTDSAEVDQLDTTEGCEAVAAATVRPVAADTDPPGCDIQGLRTSLTRTVLLRRGVRSTVSCDEPVALELRLLARARRGRGGRLVIARASDLVLAEAALGLDAAARTTRLRVTRRLRRAFPRSARIRLVVAATDRFGNVQRLERRIRVRRSR
jgi:RTX calcium-binding nonapeptide repeat (4 copies)